MLNNKQSTSQIISGNFEKNRRAIGLPPIHKITPPTMVPSYKIQNKTNNAWLWLLLLAILFIAFIIYDQPYQKEFNRKQCAVYGYQEDCKTKLKEVN